MSGHVGAGATTCYQTSVCPTCKQARPHTRERGVCVMKHGETRTPAAASMARRGSGSPDVASTHAVRRQRWMTFTLAARSSTAGDRGSFSGSFSCSRGLGRDKVPEEGRGMVSNAA
jgi:hypothetical protein